MVTWICPRPISNSLALVLQAALGELDTFTLDMGNMVDVTNKIIEQGTLLLNGRSVSDDDFTHVLSGVFNARGFTWR